MGYMIDDYNKPAPDNLVAHSIYETLIDAYCTIYEWDGLPDGYMSYDIEKLLFEYGKGIFFSLGDDFLITNYVGQGEKNVKNRWKRALPVNPWLRSSIIKPFITDTFNRNQNAVLIYNTINEISTKVLIEPFLSAIDETWLSLVNNRIAQRIQFIIDGSMDTYENIRNSFRIARRNNEYFLVIKKKGKEGNVFTDLKNWLPLQIEDKSSHIWDDYYNILNNLFTFLGLNNQNVNKKSGIGEQEVLANNELIYRNRSSKLKLRQESAKQINKIFPNLNVTVSLSSDMEINPTDFSTKFPNFISINQDVKDSVKEEGTL